MNLNKQKIIIYLLIISFVLLIANVVVDQFFKKEPGHVQEKLSSISPSEVNDIFTSIIDEFGIEKAWINKKELRNEDPDSVACIYKIRIPADLPVTVVLNELNARFINNNLRITSKESRKEKTTYLKILSGKTAFLQADFVTDPLLARHASSLGFLINNIEKLSQSELEAFLSLPESFSLIIVPSEKGEAIEKKVKESGREYTVLLNDKIDEVRFKLNEDYSEKRLKASIRSILGAFNESRLYMIDDVSDLYKSSVYPTVKTEFERRKMALIPLNSFVEIKGKDNQDLQSIFRFYCESNSNPEGKVFLINAHDYLELKGMLELYRKKGYKFVSPSSLKFGMQKPAVTEKS